MHYVLTSVVSLLLPVVAVFWWGIS